MSNRTFLIPLILIACLAGTSAATAQSTLVPLSHQVYPLLLRGETLGLFSSYDLRLLPLDRDTVRRLLAEMVQRQEALSTADRALLQQLLQEFTDPPPDQPAPSGAEIHLYRFREDNTQFFVDTRLLQSFRFSRDRLDLDPENVSETRFEGSLRGTLTRHLVLGARAISSMSLGSNLREERFDPALGQIQVTVGEAVFTDQAEGYLAYRNGRFGLLLGRQKLSWGSGLQERLGLAAGNEPMDMLRFHLDFRRVRFAYFHALLQGLGSPRYLIGHRFDIRPHRNLQFGIYETLVYAGRDIEPAYLNPFLPYHIMEHQLGDRDNNMVGLDVTAFPARGLRLFAEIFVDDFSLDYPLGTYWGNKLAYLAGMHWVQPLGLKTASLFLEYTRVDPWVYTHYDTLNVYAHYGESLGSKLGPNADRVRARLRWQPHRDVHWDFGYTFLRRGHGDLLRAHRPEDGPFKGFLRGTIEKDHIVSLGLRVQAWRDIFLGFNLRFNDRRNAGFVAGRHRLEKFANFAIEINY